MLDPMIKPIRTIKCHCGNVGQSGLGRLKPPGEGKSKRPCCLLCRCDECGYGAIQTLTGPQEYRDTDTFPGCGPMCIYHTEDVRKVRLKAAEDRAYKFNYREKM